MPGIRGIPIRGTLELRWPLFFVKLDNRFAPVIESN